MISDVDIEKFFANVDTGGLFRGVYAADQIPDVGPGPATFIINTGTSSTCGEHWISILQENSETVYFFDSFGRPPASFNDFISSRYNYCNYNEICFQDAMSQACGYYCIFIILRIVEGCRGDDAIKELRECGNRDEYVERVVKETYEKAVEAPKLHRRALEEPFMFGFLNFVLSVVLIICIVLILFTSPFQIDQWLKSSPRIYSDLNYGIYEDNKMDID